MDVQKVLQQLGNELVKQLTQAESAEELAKMAQEQNHSLTAEETEAIFAVLYPLHGKQPLEDEDLLLVSGGSLQFPVQITNPPPIKKDPVVYL